MQKQGAPWSPEGWEGWSLEDPSARCSCTTAATGNHAISVSPNGHMG